MTNEDFVSYEIAQALKKAGFDWPTLNGYSQKMRIEPDVSFGNIKEVHSWSPKNYNDNRKGIAEGVEFCSMPTLAQAQKWLRETHQWHIIIIPQMWKGLVFDYSLWHTMRGYESKNRGFNFSTYESALSAGIEAALKLIEDGFGTT